MTAWTEIVPDQQATTIRVHDDVVEIQQETEDETVTVRIAAALWPMVRDHIDKLVLGKTTQ